MISKRLHPASFSNVNTQLAQKANSAQEAWIEPTLVNSWANFGDQELYSSCAYMKDAMGFVHLKGLIGGGALDTEIFTLPAGYKPNRVLHFGVSATALFGLVYIMSGGEVNFGTGVTTWVSLNGIVFKAEA